MKLKGHEEQSRVPALAEGTPNAPWDSGCGLSGGPMVTVLPSRLGQLRDPLGPQPSLADGQQLPAATAPKEEQMV